MKKDIALSGIAGMTGKTSELVKRIKETNNIDELKDYYQKAKAAKEYLRILHKVGEMRVDLLKVEIACIIRIYELKGKIKGVSEKVMCFFGENSKMPVEYYIDKFPGCITACQIYNAFVFNKEKRNSYNNAKEAATGLRDESVNMTDEEMIHDAKEQYFDIQSAMNYLINHLSESKESFTINNMMMKLPDIPEEYKEGIKEVCRKALRDCKIDTIGDKKAPRFVTYMDKNADNQWLRIPFENATLKQLDQMIVLRDQQLKQDTKAFNNLISIQEDLVLMATDDNKEKPIRDIISGK